MAPFQPRKRLPHDVPAWVPEGALFFVTICAKERCRNALATSDIAPILIEAAAHRHATGNWFIRLFLVMPDHVHALVAVPSDRRLGREIGSWKRLTARKTGVRWQDGFFEHRMRADESFDLKFRYVLENPARAGLVSKAEEWPWKLAPDLPSYRS